MAFLSKKPSSFLVLAFYLFLFALLQSIHSLSTVAISENANQTLVCALTQSSSDQHNSHLNCTSFPGGIQVPLSPLNSSISGIVAGNGFICAVRSQPTSSNSIMGCWRFSPSAEHPEEEWSYKRIYRGLPIDDLSAGDSHICGITSGGLECWQWEEFNSTIPGFRNFTSVAVGEDLVCGLSAEFGNIKCLSPQPENNIDNNTVSGYDEPSGNYSAIAAGLRHTCAIFVNNGSLQCWGGEENPPEGEFTTLALGENRSCAIRPNGTVACWGEKSFGLPESLNSTSFVAIQARRSVFCGVTASDFSLVCWGSTIFENSFSAVLENVVPGPCRSVCPCRPLPGYGSFCSQGQMICEPCVIKRPPTPTPPPPTPTPPPPPPPEHGGGGGWNEKMVAFLVVGCAGSASLLAACCFLFFRYCNIRGCRVHDSGPLDMEANTRPPRPATAPVLEKKLSHLVSMGNGGHLEEFPLHLLLKATNNFWDDHKIGAGSFGSVYHAVLDDGREVAVKRAETMVTSSQAGATKRQQDDRDNAFVSELESLSHLNHKNLVKLLGYCEESGELILVYEYMRNGTLHDHLHNLEESPLMSTWPARMKVALDAARGIEYLHVYAVPQIIHRDIKSSNILLDDSWNAKVSDFGLSLMAPQQQEAAHLSSLRAAGTVGYMDPEYYRLQQLTPKSDVYSFGVLLLEILSGCKAIHQTEFGVPRNVVDFLAPYIVQEEIHRVLDPRVPPPTPFEIEAVAYVGYIAVDCVMPEGRHRPTISEIVSCLERALAACSPPSPQLSRSTTGSITEIGNNLERAQASSGSPPSPAGPPPSPQLCQSPTGSSNGSITEIGNSLERAQASSSPSSPPPSPQLFRSPTGSSPAA